MCIFYVFFVDNYYQKLIDNEVRYRIVEKKTTINELILHTLLSTIKDTVAVINAEADVLYWNEGAEKMYHIKSEEIIGRKIYDFFNKEDLMILRTLTTKETIQDVYHQPRPDKHVLISSSPIYDENNKLIGSITVDKDITQTIILNNQLSNTSKELQLLKKKVSNNGLSSAFSSIKGSSPQIKQTIQLAEKVARTDATVIILGESGVGKEIFAQAIHEQSLRRKNNFIPINCGAIPETLFENELFGYERGAYTGASKHGKPGKIELADNGTLFLDEVGELPLDMQVKLLRALQENKIYRIGGTVPRPINVRIIAATNRDLQQMVNIGTFRADLFYRLNVFPISIPPLRERINDIPDLIYDFLYTLREKHQKTPPILHQDALDYMMTYHWPGNVRELLNILERLVILNETGEINVSDVIQVLPIHETTPAPSTPRTFLDEKEDLEEKRMIEALHSTYGNKTAAAQILGMSRATLYKKIKKYNIKT